MAYDNASNFASPTFGEAWYTNYSTREICSLASGNFLRDLNARLSSVFGASVARTQSPSFWQSIGLTAPTPNPLPSGSTWNDRTYAFLRAAMLAWYGGQNPYTLQLQPAVTGARVTRDALRIALWFTYHTSGGLASVVGDMVPSIAPNESVPVSAIEVKGDATMPPFGATIAVSRSGRTCQAAPSMDVAPPSVGGIPVLWIAGAAVAAGVGWWVWSARQG